MEEYFELEGRLGGNESQPPPICSRTRRGPGGALMMGLAARRRLPREENVFTFSTKPADTSFLVTTRIFPNRGASYKNHNMQGGVGNCHSPAEPRQMQQPDITWFLTGVLEQRQDTSNR